MSFRDQLVKAGTDIQNVAYEKMIAEFENTARKGIQAASGSGLVVPAPVIPPELKARTRKDLEYIPQWYGKLADQYASGSLDKLTAMQSGLDSAHDEIDQANPKAVAYEEAKDLGAYWTGEAAKSFISDYVRPFHGVRDNQANLLKAAKGAIGYMHDLLEASRADLTGIADATKSVLEQYEPAHGSGGEATFALTVLGIVLSGVGAATEGAAAVSLSLLSGTVGAMAGPVGTEVDKAGKNTALEPLSGGSVKEILESMGKAIGNFGKGYQAKQDALTQAIHKDASVVGDKRIKFEPKRPKLADVKREDLTTQVGKPKLYSAPK